MAEKRGRGANVGSASLILIFIVLCLGTFGLLALSSAGNDLDLARRNEAAVAEYYRADGEAEVFLMKVNEALAQVLKEDPENPQDELEQLLGENYDRENKTAQTEIPMENGQALSVILGLFWEDGEGTAEVLQWKVINAVDYEIDQDMPVWDGQQSDW